MSLYSTEMGDHLKIIFSSMLLILLNSLISLRELYKTPISIHKILSLFGVIPAGHDQITLLKNSCYKQDII